jgi:hypothetical protein
MISHRKTTRALWLTAAGLTCVLMGWLALPAQGPSLEQQIAGIAATAAQNQKALAEYNWQEQETVTIKDKVQSQRLFEAQLGPDGRIKRMALGLAEENLSQAGEGHGVREWIAEKKKHAVMTYGQDVKELAETYTQQIDDELLRLAYKRGDIANESTPTPGIRKLSINNYAKLGDLVVLVFAQEGNELQSLEVSSYLTGTREPVHILAGFSKSSGGPNHLDLITATATKRRLSVSIRNQSYQRIVRHVNR